jgi:DNA-binding Xre family transcriptional regulator
MGSLTSGAILSEFAGDAPANDVPWPIASDHAQESGRMDIALAFRWRIFTVAVAMVTVTASDTAEKLTADNAILCNVFFVQGSNMAKKKTSRGALAAAIISALAGKNMSTYALAAAARISQPVLHRFLSGERGINLDTAERLCDFLGLELIGTRARR